MRFFQIWNKEQARTLLARAADILGALSVLNIGIRSEPFDDPSLFINRRGRAEKKPPIRSIKAAEAPFNLTWLARSQNASPVIHEPVQIVRVNRNCPAPTSRLFRREPRVVEPAPVKEFGGTVRSGRPRQDRNCVDNRL